MDGQPAVRVVRPRPLGLNDRIPVFWAGQEPKQELKQIDGGALYRHLVAASTPTGSKKRKRGQKYQAPKEGAPDDHLSPKQEAQQKPLEADGPIVIPRVRPAADYDLNLQAAAHHGPMIEGDIAAAPYLRHKEHPDIYNEHQAAEYDADEDDIAWLHGINCKNGQNGILAAAIGLYHQVSARISGSADHAAATERQQPQQQQQQLRLSLEDFEKAIDILEQQHFSAVKAWWEEEQAGPSTSAPRVPQIPSMKALLPRMVALEALSALLPDRKLAAQVLDYWLKKRAEEGGPLLARLWFEQPWKLVAFAHDIVDDDEDFDENLPFMAVEPRSKQKQTRRGGQRRKLNEEDALEALYTLRNELETVRTLADQVRKREKLKRQLLLLSQQEWQMRRQLAMPPGKAARGPKQGAAAARPAGRAAAAAQPSPHAGRGLAQAAGAAPALPSPPGSPGTELNKALARVTLAAAAAASPHEGDKARQTRTAAAAAEFEMTFAAKRRRLMASTTAAAAAADTDTAPTDAVVGRGLVVAAAAAGGPEAGPSRTQKGRQPAKRGRKAAAAGGLLQRRVGRRNGRAALAEAAAAAAAAGETADDELEELSMSVQEASPSHSAASSDSESYEDYELEEASEDAELPSDLVAEHGTAAAAAAAAAGPGQQSQRQRARSRQQQPEERRGRGGARPAAAAARAAAAAVMAAEGSSDEEVSSGSGSEDDSDQQQHKGRSKGGHMPRRRQQQQQQEPLPGPLKGRRRGRSAPTAVPSSSELQAEADGDSDSVVQVRKTRRPAGAATIAAPPAAAGRRVAAAAEAHAHGASDAPQVLRPHNQQPKQPAPRRHHADSQHQNGHKSAGAAAQATGAVAASSGRGAAVPVSMDSKGHGGGSVRRSSAAVAAVGRSSEVLRRRQRQRLPATRGGIGKAELRSLGVGAEPAASHPRTRGAVKGQ